MGTRSRWIRVEYVGEILPAAGGQGERQEDREASEILPAAGGRGRAGMTGTRGDGDARGRGRAGMTGTRGDGMSWGPATQDILYPTTQDILLIKKYDTCSLGENELTCMFSENRITNNCK